MATAQYMGPLHEKLSKLADLLLVVDGHDLPAHSSTLAQHSPVVLDLVVEAQERAVPGKKIELSEPFADKSLSGVVLFLKCCYQPQHVKRFMGESLDEDPSETSLHELLLLAHYFQATSLLAECEEHMSGDFVDRLQPGSLTKWLGTAEKCGCTQLQQLLMERVGKQLAMDHTPAQVKGLITHLSPDSAAGIISSAWDGIEAGLGGGSAVAAAAAASAAEAQAARAAAEERAAAAALDVDRLSAQLQALQTSGGGAGAAVAAAGGGDVAAALQAWLPPNLQIVSLEPEAFAVEWTVPGFSKLQPGVMESAGFGPEAAWRVRMSPFSDGPQSELVGVFLTFAGAGPAEKKYTVSMVNQADPARSRTMEAVSTFVPASNQDTWGTPQFIMRQEVLDPTAGFSSQDTVKIRVSVAAPTATAPPASPQ